MTFAGNDRDINPNLNGIFSASSWRGFPRVGLVSMLKHIAKQILVMYKTIQHPIASSMVTMDFVHDRKEKN